MKKTIIIFFIIAATQFFSCAGITINKKTNAFNSKIFLAFFDNKTVKSGVNEILTEYLKDIFISSDSAKLLNKRDADYFVTGEIKEYTVTVESHSDKEIVEMYSLKIIAGINIKKRNQSGEPVDIYSFDCSDKFFFTETSSITESEKKAIDESCSKLAYKIFDKIRQAVKDDEEKNGGRAGR